MDEELIMGLPDEPETIKTQIVLPKMSHKYHQVSNNFDPGKEKFKELSILLRPRIDNKKSKALF